MSSSVPSKFLEADIPIGWVDRFLRKSPQSA